VLGAIAWWGRFSLWKLIAYLREELFIAFGRENTTLGKERLNIPLPPNPTYPAIMAVGYYVIGRIQAQKPPWFRESLESFAKRASEVFGQKIEPIVKYK